MSCNYWSHAPCLPIGWALNSHNSSLQHGIVPKIAVCPNMANSEQPIGTPCNYWSHAPCLPIGWAINSHNSSLQHGTVSKLVLCTQTAIRDQPIGGSCNCLSPALAAFLLAGLKSAITPVCGLVPSRNSRCGLRRPIGISCNWLSPTPAVFLLAGL